LAIGHDVLGCGRFRGKAVPNGMVGYLVGKIVVVSA
jgi:hypothetical protein